MKELLRRFVREEEGISAVEYALLGALVAGGIALAAYNLGDAVATELGEMETTIETTPGGTL